VKDGEMLDIQTTPAGGVHPSAVIHEDALLGEGVTVGPGAVIGPGVVVGEGTEIGSHVLIERDTVIGRECRIHHGAVLGSDPQDLKFEGERTQVVIGDRTVIREYVTINRGTRASGSTRVGSDCLLMAYVHVAHDCQLGDRVILANAVNMGGHVTIGDWAIVGGMTPIHQFVRIGEHAFVGGASRVAKDVAPFVRCSGNPLEMSGLNSVGLRRRGFDAAVRLELKRAYRLFFKSSLNVTQAIERAREELDLMPEVEQFVRFFEDSERGVHL
jgi:UDP-N-acetylglucosamine acyltransferase